MKPQIRARSKRAENPAVEVAIAMEQGVQLFPTDAAAEATRLDRLFIFLLGNAVFFTFLIAFLILYFVIRYRRGTPADRRGAPAGSWKLETAWAVIPLAIMMVSFAWGAKLNFDAFHAPAAALDVYVVGKQWMWRIQHTEGPREINELHVPIGQIFSAGTFSFSAACSLWGRLSWEASTRGGLSTRPTAVRTRTPTSCWPRRASSSWGSPRS